MNVVATEADAVKPLIIDTILTVAGERYDFVIEANQSPSIILLMKFPTLLLSKFNSIFL